MQNTVTIHEVGPAISPLSADCSDGFRSNEWNMLLVATELKGEQWARCS